MPLSEKLFRPHSAGIAVGLPFGQKACKVTNNLSHRKVSNHFFVWIISFGLIRTKKN